MRNSIYERLLNKKAKLGVIGLGYVGLPIALEFSRKLSVIGFDINDAKLETMRNARDPNEELDNSDFDGCDITFSSRASDLNDVRFFVVAVPTPIDDANIPDLSPLLNASRSVGKVLKKGDYVVFESTVYPGCTEEDCIPILERESGLKFREDFMVGYSPERTMPGNKERSLRNIVKVVSGCCSKSLEEIAKTYELIIKAGVHRAPSIKVAEAAKVTENTQRDVNIALMNELSIIFNKLDINTFDVLEAASGHRSFRTFYPGLVGGHCISVDPYYLVHKAKLMGYQSQVISSGRYVNDSMGDYIAKETVKKLIAKGKHTQDAKVLIMGATYKENVRDIRNSKVIDIIKELESFQVKVDLEEPLASPAEMKRQYGVELIERRSNDYDAVIVAVQHKEYRSLTEEDFQGMMRDDKGILVDVKGIYRGEIKHLDYWSL